MTRLLRHPLSFVLLGLVALFVIFFLVLPALTVLFHVIILLAIVWVVFSLLRVARRAH